MCQFCNTKLFPNIYIHNMTFKKAIASQNMHNEMLVYLLIFRQFLEETISLQYILKLEYLEN